ncbi:alkaline phosphatase PhoV [Abditibacteriota bacterium]|nr:alkaline phosphatase PhoV [Abditibacteriota bacterium]
MTKSLKKMALVAATVLLPVTASAAPAKRPRLVVEIVVDQLRADYLDRFDDLFLPPGRGQSVGGFRFLRERGADFAAARYPHFPLFTAPGHAIVSTGGYPYKTGIVGNDWFDKTTRAPMYSVSDPGAKVVADVANSKAKPMSPFNLRSSTVGDELKMATGGRAKVVSLALKDRPSILLGGRLSDATIWFDDSTGHWISSDFYCKTGQLPAWVQGINALQTPRKDFGQNWTSDLPANLLNRGWKPVGAPPFDHPVYGLGTQFPHPVNGGLSEPRDNFYKAWVLTPWANQFVFDTARQAVQSEGLGRDEVPDLLAFNLSTNDYVGHAFGPDSPEMVDITTQTDRQMAQFFRFLDRTIPGGLANVTIALTADHGVVPIVEDLKAAGFRAGRLEESEITAAAQNALTERFGQGKWILDYVEPSLYLDDDALKAAKVDPEEAQKVAARAIAAVDGVYTAFPRTQIEEGLLPDNDIGMRIAKGYYPKVSGDVLVVTEAYHFIEASPFKNNTTHGTMYSYDTRVPLLLNGFGIHPGIYRDEVSPADIAPSLCQLLGIAYPSACDGKPLATALR